MREAIRRDQGGGAAHTADRGRPDRGGRSSAPRASREERSARREGWCSLGGGKGALWGGSGALWRDEGTYRLSARELDRGDWGLRGNHTCAHRVEKGVHYDRLYGGNDDAHRWCFSIAWLWADAEKAVSVDVESDTRP